MDPRLLDVYNAELEYLKDQSLVFAETHKTAAKRLGMNTKDLDPYVERLLEGVAFLSSRVQLKIEDQFPQFTQSLLQAIQPHYLAPTPSICIAAFEPTEGDQGLASGHIVPRRTQLTAEPPSSISTPVTFETGHEVTLWPLQVTKADYIGSRAATAKFADKAGVKAQSAIKIRIEPTAGIDLQTVDADQLDFYLDGNEATPNELYRQLIGDAVGVVAQAPDEPSQDFVKLELPKQHGFSGEDSLLPLDGRTLAAYRTLTEYFACPERFRFVRFDGLKPAFALSSGAIEIIILLKRSTDVLVQSVSEKNFKLFATPAINLFEKQLNRVQYSEAQHEFRVVPDKTSQLDFEVFRILDAKAYDRDNSEPRTISPLYAIGSDLYDHKSALFYTTQSRMRRLSPKERRLRQRNEYIGTDLYMSVTSPGDPERFETVHEIAIRALVTNRELPDLLEFSGDHHLHASGIPARNIRVVLSPTSPKPPMGIDDAAWRVIGHLTPNYATMLPEDGSDGDMLRNHLALYGRQEDPVMTSHVDGIIGVRSSHVTRRVPGLGRLAMARGLEVEITLDDTSFDQSRIFLFSAVVERFLSEFSAINSFTECRFKTKTEGVFAKWPPRIGRRQAI